MLSQNGRFWQCPVQISKRTVDLRSTPAFLHTCCSVSLVTFELSSSLTSNNYRKKNLCQHTHLLKLSLPSYFLLTPALCTLPLFTPSFLRSSLHAHLCTHHVYNVSADGSPPTPSLSQKEGMAAREHKSPTQTGHVLHDPSAQHQVGHCGMAALGRDQIVLEVHSQSFHHLPIAQFSVYAGRGEKRV